MSIMTGHSIMQLPLIPPEGAGAEEYRDLLKVLMPSKIKETLSKGSFQQPPTTPLPCDRINTTLCTGSLLVGRTLGGLRMCRTSRLTHCAPELQDT